MTASPPQRRLNRRNAAKLAAFILLTVALILVSQHPWIREHVRFEQVEALVAQASRLAARPEGPWVFVGGFAVLTTLYVPPAVMVVLGGLVFGFWKALALCWIGAMLGATATFVIARYLLEDYFKPRLEQSMFDGLVRRLETDGAFTVLYLRLLFFLVPPFNWAIGATGVRLKDYVVGTAVGMLPWLVAILVAVNKLKTVRRVQDLLQWESIAVGIGFGLLFVVIGVARKRFHQRTKEEPSSRP